VPYRYSGMSTMHAHLEEIHLQREALFAQLVAAFITRDFAVFDEAVREDVLASLPGTSRLAGTHNGREPSVASWSPYERSSRQTTWPPRTHTRAI